MSPHSNVARDSAVTSGASRGFTVLLLGGAVQPLVGAAVPALGLVWLLLVAVAAFAWSAWIASSPREATLLQAVAAAAAAYALVVPVVVMATGTLDPVQAACTALTASAVGAAVFKARSLTTREAR